MEGVGDGDAGGDGDGSDTGVDGGVEGVGLVVSSPFLCLFEWLVDGHPSYFGRQAFHAAGRHWVFFEMKETDTGPCLFHYASSPDGISWEAPVRFDDPAGGFFSLLFDGSYVHFVSALHDYGDPLYYQRGLPGADGRILWSPREVAVPSSGPRWNTPTVAVDTSGRPAIWYHNYDRGNYEPWATMSSSNDGSWNAVMGFPRTLISSMMTWRGAPAATNDGAMHFVSCNWLSACSSHRYSGGTLGGSETIGSASPQGSVVAFEDEVHFLSGSGVHHQRYLGDWRVLHDMAPELVANGTIRLSLVDATTGQLGLGTITNDVLWYRMATRNGDGTYHWDTANSECYDGRADGINGTFSVYREGTAQKLWAVITTGSGNLRVVSCGP
jgi:hypothetical protein